MSYYFRQPQVSLKELNYWWQRRDDALIKDEPLYVTPEEFNQLKNWYTYPDERWLDYSDVELRVLGTPVIVDAEKAAEQKDG